MVATFGESFRGLLPHRILLHPFVADGDSEKSVSATSAFFSLSNGGCLERHEARTRTRRGAMSGHSERVSAVGHKGRLRIGREGDSYSLSEERVARERRDTRCAPLRRRSVAFGQVRGSSAVDRANTAAPQPPGGPRECGGVVGDEGGRMWALRRAHGAKVASHFFQ